MAGWDDAQAMKIRGRWQGRDTGRLTLYGACPNCLHSNAFDDVAVFNEDALPDVAEVTFGRRKLAAAPRYPDTALVTCACGDASHGTTSGCGRSGYVSTDEL
jgi:hypothetical protein